MGLSLESLIGVQVDGRLHCTVSTPYLRALMRIANERFEENRKRIERFRDAVLQATSTKNKKNGDREEWEDADTRRERKRAEGLRRKAELLGRGEKDGGKGDDDVDLDLSVNTDFK